MKYRGPIFASIVLVSALFFAFYPKVDNAEKEAVLMRTMLNGLNQLHYNPQQINDDFSKKIYELSLERMDIGRRFFTQQDIDQLKPYELQLDDQVLTGTYQFFDLSLSLLNKGIDKAEGYYKEILAEPFTFDGQEDFELNGEKRDYAENDAQLKDFWRRYLKFETLTRIEENLKEQEEAGEEGEKKPFEEVEEEARASVLKMINDWFGRIRKLKRSDRLSFYLNSITNVYDPHTGYFEPIDKENFNIRMSGRLEGIGARLVTDGDYTRVVSIVVGGPAWKGKELDKDDLILSVAQGDDDEVVDIKGMIVDDVVQLIRGDKGTKVRLTIKKKIDSSVKEISIVRDVVNLEEGFAKSLILDGSIEEERVGYIYLPRFYADFEDRNGRFCSKDVATEIEKLKGEKVDGIILDLRNNGGGSLRDVVKMSGFFIEEGPIVQVRSRGQKPEVLEDLDARVQYSGPLIVMVNSLSASASEILAAALQDYDRAIIVGSNSTFGKGTVQRFFNLDRAIRGYEEYKPLGEIKLTTQKFYRINGGSTQLKGVTPDIILPDQYHFIKTGEKDHEFPMEWTEIEPVKYNQKVMKIDDQLEGIKAKSQARVDQSATFKKVLDNARRLKEQRDETVYPLTLEDYSNFVEGQEADASKYDNLFDEIVNTGVTNLEVDIPSIHENDVKKERNNDWIQSVSKDVYIKETLNIMHDLIESEQN